MNQVQLDPRGYVPEPQEDVCIILQSADGGHLGSMKFSAPIIESIESLVAQTRLMLGIGPKIFVSKMPQAATPFFTIVGWDDTQRKLTVQLKK